MRRRVLGKRVRTTPRKAIDYIILQLLPSSDGHYGLCDAPYRELSKSYPLRLTSLNELLPFLSTQYSVKRPENLFDKTSPRSDQQIITELDSMMNKWMDSVPAHRKSRTRFLTFGSRF